MKLRPVTLTECRRFVAEHHRHNIAPRGWLFGVGLEVDGEIRGVGVVSRPVARGLQDGATVEITRTCTLGDKNANSMIYGALLRAARALGWRRVVTYTLAEESGASLRAVGFRPEADLKERRAWVRYGGANDGRSDGRYQHDLFGNERRPAGPKVRWVKEFAK